MEILMRDLPEDERPREKLLSCGAKNVSDAELLAILLRTGTKQRSVIRVAEEVLSKYKDKGLHAISHMTPRDISTVPGVGPAKAATVIAAVELGKRIASRAALQVESIRGPEDAANYAMPLLRDEVQEHFAVILLDTKNHILMMPIVTKGTLSSSVAHPREVFHQEIVHYHARVGGQELAFFATHEFRLLAHRGFAAFQSDDFVFALLALALASHHIFALLYGRDGGRIG